MRNFQFGFDLFFFVLWWPVSAKRFGARVTPLMLQPGQMPGISPAEVASCFGEQLILRDGWRLYRSIKKD